jgi:hypothetical protein
LQTDLTVLSYDDWFDPYKPVVAAVGRTSPQDAARLEGDIIVPLNDELTRRSRLRRRG